MPGGLAVQGDKKMGISQKIDHSEQNDAIIGRVFVGSLAVILLLGGGAVFGWFMYGVQDEPIEVIETELQLPAPRATSMIQHPAVTFTEVSKEWGIDFVHQNGAVGDKLLPETMGSGCAAFDYDNDNDIDLLFVNSTSWADDSSSAPATLKLFRNDGNQFHDVTEAVGLDVSLYGMGVAVGDVDNDGHLDLFISAVGVNRLFVQRDGKFVDVTESAGVGGDKSQWSTSCGFFDYDQDGLLDLFVCNYLRWSAELDLAQEFRLAGAGRAYGPPKAFGGTFPYLYHNEGGGRFRDVSAAAGVQVTNMSTGVPVAKSLGLVTVDIDQDGWLDLIVANDTVRNFLLLNQRNGTFREMGIEAGIAFDPEGRARGAMGIDVGFVRDDGELAVAIGNFSNESSAFYVKQPRNVLFLDAAMATGFGPPTREDLTFAVFFFDYDLDGRLDIFGANGHLENDIEKVQASQRYEQSPHLFWNRGSDKGSNEFSRVVDSVTGDLADPIVGRGATFADLDGDGDLDLVITQSGRRAKVFRNDQSLGHHWLRIRLRGNGTSCNRDAIGATIELRVGDNIVKRQVSRTRSYLSQVSADITIGLGKSEQVDQLLIRWPDGSPQNVEGPIAAGTVLTVEQK
jgi:hypothetical protein